MADADAEDWIERKDLDTATKVKLLGLDVVTNRTLSFVNTEQLISVAEPTLKLLLTLLHHRGARNAKSNDQ